MMMSLSSSRHSSTVASLRVCANDIAATPCCESLAATIHEQGPERATPAQPVLNFRTNTRRIAIPSTIRVKRMTADPPGHKHCRKDATVITASTYTRRDNIIATLHYV